MNASNTAAGHLANMPALGLKTISHKTAKFTGGTCPGCGEKVYKFDEITVTTTTGGAKATYHYGHVAGL